MEIGEFNKLISTVKKYSNFETVEQVLGCKRAVLDSTMLTFSKLEEYCNAVEDKESKLNELTKISSLCLLNLAGICNDLQIRLTVNESVLNEPIIVTDMCQTLFNLCDLVLSIDIHNKNDCIVENHVSIFNFMINYTKLLSVNGCVLTFENISKVFS